MSSRLVTSIAFASALMIAPGAGIAADSVTRVATAEHAKTTSAIAETVAAENDRLSKLMEAADLGVFEAQDKLAAMYASGRGIDANPARAFGLYKRIINDNDDIHPRGARAKSVALAYVALGDYYRIGIPGVITADKTRAVALLHYAASFFGSAEAQYELAKMYLDGEGVTRNERLAVSWLANAVKKRHAKSQALLGSLLMRGADGVARQPAKGLALLSLARQNASGDKEARLIEAMYGDAQMRSKAQARERALELVSLWQVRMGRPGYVVSAQSTAIAEGAASSQVSDAANSREGITQVGLSADSD